MYKLLFLCLITVFSNKVIAQTQKLMTLEECIRYAYENNLDIRQSEINQKIAEQNIIQNKGNFLPTLNGSVSHNYNFGRTIDPFTNQFTNNQVRSNNFGVMGSVTLFNGFQLHNSLKQAEYSNLAATYDIAFLKNDIALNITSVYLQILFTQELIKLAENQVMLSQQQFDRMTKLVEAGKMAQSSLPDIETQLATEEVRLVEAQNQLKIHILSLSQLLNLPLGEEITVTRPEVIITTDTTTLSYVNAIYEQALLNQPQIKSADYTRLSATKAIASAKGYMSPRLTFNASLSTLFASSSQILLGYQFNGTQLIGFTSAQDSVFAPNQSPVFEKKPFNAQVRDNLNKFVGFTLSFPFINNFQVRTAIAREKLGLQRAEVNLQNTKNNLHRAIERAYIDASNASKRMAASHIAVRAAEQSLTNAEKRLEVGQINSFDYAQVKNKSAQAQSDLIQANFDYLFKTKILEFYKGMPLKL